MKFNTLPRRVAATGAVTALTAGALVSLTTTAAQADTVTQTYSCTANGVPLSVTLDTDIPQLALVAAGGPYPAGEAVAAGQVPDGVTNTFTITDDTKTLLDTAQTSKIDFTSFAGTLGNSTVPADLPDVDPATDFHQNPDTTWSFDADGLNLAFRMPKVGTFDVLAPSSFSFEATTVAFGVLPVTCNADAAPGGYGHPITVVKNDSTTKGSSNSPVKKGAKAVLKAKVSAQNHAPTGKVTFKQGKKKLGTATIKKGKAVLKLKLSKGTHKIKAFYGGDGYTNESTSAVFKVVQK